jgi:hypothetical protein
MIEVKLVADVYCMDGCAMLHTLHNLPFVPTVGQKVSVSLPKLPEGWNEDAWEIDWDDEQPSIYIDVNGSIEIWFSQDIKHMTKLSVITDMKRAGWMVGR